MSQQEPPTPENRPQHPSRFESILLSAPSLTRAREQPHEPLDERLTQSPTEPQVCIQIPLEPLVDLQRHRPLHLSLG